MVIVKFGILHVGQLLLQVLKVVVRVHLNASICLQALYYLVRLHLVGVHVHYFVVTAVIRTFETILSHFLVVVCRRSFFLKTYIAVVVFCIFVRSVIELFFWKHFVSTLAVKKLFERNFYGSIFLIF